ncbi:tRNA (cytidine(34)-2'-O)-methyltransferase [Parachlamydia acanthamoebae]|uniref:tRNA (cytidine(34)-2'-O)-methyltransferase n=1 Tax=Parachlamydia acanthamoebae TaxID=83552 RepID=UPI0001C17B08|nr:tRNA (cytidine(34)-2'-O)-methyltransferase [Parachlamydia acanthamoebae]EFB40164.1 hypothetical protein pah_c253o020 [Parachlamydia acanthamoebae str. Hall's coccus]
MAVVLFQPQIPQNTGNVVRTCAVTGQNLILIGPLGFSITDRWLKRAGLDYWEGVNVQVLDNLEELLDRTSENFYFFSSHATQNYTDVSYQPKDLLIFGAETHGLPESITNKWPNRCVKIPMVSGVRCLNLATSVGIGVYEAWRQQGFKKE